MKKLILFCLLGFNFGSYCQMGIASNVYRTAQFDKNNKNKIGELTNGVEGSAYLFDEKQINKGKIFYENNNGLEINNINYNLLSNTLESKFSKDSTFIIDDSSIKEIVLNRLKYRILSMENKKGICQVIFKSQKFDLIKKFNLVFEKARINSMTQQPEGNDKYVIQEEYFLNKLNNGFQKLKLSKKSILDAFSDKQEEIKKYVKDNDLNYVKIDDVIKIFAHYELLN